LNPSSPQAGLIDGLWDFALVSLTLVYLVTMAAVVWALLRKRRPELEADRTTDHGDAIPEAPREERTDFAHAQDGPRYTALWLTSTLTAVYLLGYFLLDLRTGRALVPSHALDAVEISLTGHQFWWDVEYEDSVPARQVRTANEIHIPVGRPVHIVLKSDDVIHSFWVPELQGKRDLVPGREGESWLQAEREGVYEGQCAEFCGEQHAKMRIVVVAESQQAYDAWYENQLRPAATPTDSLRLAGQNVLENGPCSSCHTVTGTRAGARAGPDLTHLASRKHIGAGILPNDEEHLTSWIADPQSFKPGAQMPAIPLAPDQLRAVVAYLRGLS
jgi:cytochrome c oxidase subunit II